jgi:hypothetical protein
MRRALELARDPSSAQFDFLRDDAALGVLIVTEEADCSAAPAHQDAVFGPDGDRVFWPFPDASSPPSAVCWNAGVQCSGSPAAYTSCDPADKGVDGGSVAGADAVLVPVQEYVSFLQAIENDKRALDPDADVLVSVVAGVPQGYPGTGGIPYAHGPDGDDPGSFQGRFGIGPGCTDADFEAVPPVRLRVFAEAFAVGGHPGLFSVCADLFNDAIQVFLDSMRRVVRPLCVPVCVADIDPSPGVQADCMMVGRWTEGGAPQELMVPLCAPGDELPPGANACWVPLVDRTGDTATTGDDMSRECVDRGWNLEVRIARREGFPIPSGATVSISCEPAPEPAIACPEL